MTTRIFGPIRGAGTQLREERPGVELVPGMLGSTVMIGVLERGAEDDISVVPNSAAVRRKNGGLLNPADFNAPSLASLETPLHNRHFYDYSQESGYLINLRVVPKTNDATNDDRPDKAVLPVFNRENVPIQIGTLTALNGGRWAGQREEYLGKITGTPGTDFPTDNQIQLDMGVLTKVFKRDEYKNGYIWLHDLTTPYKIVSNTSDGLFTLAADEDVPTDWAAAGPPAGPRYDATVYRDNLNARGDEKRMTVEFFNGTLDPVGFFGLRIRVDGTKMLDYENLSMDTDSPYYWEDVINSDPNNDLVEVDDTFTGSRTVASARPANRYGLSDALTDNVLTIPDPVIRNLTIAGTWAPVLTWVWGSKTVPQTLRIEVTDDGTDAFKVTTDIGNREYTGTIGVNLVMDDYLGEITITDTVNDTTGDYFDLDLRPLRADELIGGTVQPNTDDNRVYNIVDNDLTTVTVSGTDQMLTGASANDPFMLSWPERFGGGYDGYIAGMVSSDYEDLLNPVTSPLRKLKNMNLGLVKVSVPGIGKPDSGGAVNLQKKVRALCLAYNWSYRAEFPDGILTDQDALDWINNTFGRLDLATIFYPTFMYIRDPFADAGSDAREFLISNQGMQLGREALVATQWDGYHKAAAGIDVTLPDILRATQLGRSDDPNRVDEELLNPAGINCYRWVDGVIVAWGDRTLDSTTQMRWKHKREQLSHYGNILLENTDFAIFAINDRLADADVKAALFSYFLKEFRKRAIRGNSFIGGSNPAAIIKMDSENNTDATRGQGNQNVSISLRLADTVERLIITLGAMGITETF